MSSTKLFNCTNLHIALVYLLSTLVSDKIVNSLPHYIIYMDRQHLCGVPRAVLTLWFLVSLLALLLVFWFAG